MTTNRISIQKNAMTYGTYMGLFWVAKFILFPLGFSYNFLFLLFFVLTIAVPFICYRMTKNFRDTKLNGTINWFQAWAFNLFVFLFAALLVGVAHYAYFQFLDHGFIIESYDKVLTNIKLQTKSLSLEDDGAQFQDQLSQVQKMIDTFKRIKPIEIVYQLFTQNIFWGNIIALLVAFIVPKKSSVPMPKVDE
ncbi:MAG: DUF4199 domain-containing protein [Bacteroidaceae bacterium]